MKKISVYAIAIAPIIAIWFAWGGFSNDMGTFVLSLAAVFTCTVISDKMRESAEPTGEKK